MAEVVLYHHVQGLTTGVQSFADELRQAGHTVHTPDLFDGHTFDTIEEGMAFARETGFGALVERGAGSRRGEPPRLVYAGFSFGVWSRSSSRRPGPVLAAPCSCPAVSRSRSSARRGPRASRFRCMARRPTRSSKRTSTAARALADSTDEAELFLYPGNEHLFADSSLPAYDAAAAALLTGRVLAFLDALQPRRM